MRNWVLILFLGFLCNNLTGQNLLKTKVSIQAKNQAISEILQQISQDYNIQFTYSSDFVALEQRASLSIQNQSLNKVLRLLFRRRDIEFKKLGNQIVLRASKKAPIEKLSSKTFPPILSTKSPLYQTVRGTIIDSDSKTPLVGASISVLNSDPFLGSATDIEGHFILSKVPVGRQSFEVSYLGYESYTLSNIQVISGKELVLPIELKESTTALQEVIVSANIDKMTPLNEMAMVSTRPFSVEETSRYAASFMDPARMAKSFAGVSYRDDLENKIVIRGNAPTNLLWRLEGIEIINPNHFSDIGSSGGSISMLSISTLSNSDFITGAFPAEYGNTISGVFDLRLRNGNHQKQEGSVMLGTLGLELSLEGPFKKGENASYLFNYRYSSLDILDRLGFNPVPEGSVPRYTDFSFKMNFPTKNSGKFTLFGLGGYNYDNIFSNDENPNPIFRNFSDEENITIGVFGASHLKLISDKSYLKTVTAFNVYRYRFDFQRFDSLNNNVWFRELEKYNTLDWRTSVLFNHKLDARNSIRTGLTFNHSFYNLSFIDTFQNDNPREEIYLDEKGYTYSLQAYAQWKYRLNNYFTLNSGLHFLHYGLTQTGAIEPRIALQFQNKRNHFLNLGIGLHSHISHITTYLFRTPLGADPDFQPFSKAKLPKALHLVLGYDFRVSESLRFKAEAYYQHIYQVPVSDDPNEQWVSLLNLEDTYDVVNQLNGQIVSKGLGANRGLELTLEQFLHNGFYYLSTFSLFRSEFSDIQGNYFSTQFDANFIFNLLGGKEFRVGVNNILGFNAKFILAGGNRFSPIDLEASIERQAAVIVDGQLNTSKVDNYSRIDFSIKYALNRPKVTHEFLLEIQNLLDRRNEQNFDFDRFNSRIVTIFQTGFIPNINYRLSF